MVLFTMIEFVDSFDYYDYVILRHIVIQGQPQQAVAHFIGNGHVSTGSAQAFACRGGMEGHVMEYCLYASILKMVHQSVSFFQ